MKRFPQIDRFFTAVCSFSILALFVLLTSCEKDSLNDDTYRVKALKLDTASLRTLITTYDDCSSVCIEEGSETFYAKSDSQSEPNGQQRTISYNAYNTEYEFVVEATYEDNNTATDANINIIIKGVTYPFNHVAKGTTISQSIGLGEWQACDVIDFSINAKFNNGQTNTNNQNSNKNGNSNSNPNAAQNDIDFNELSYSLIGVCSSTCDESFSYEDNQDGSYTFHYISSEDLEGAEVKFTCPHITDFVILDGKDYEVNPGNSKGSPTVLTWTGDIQACTEITFTLAFDPDCDQTNSGKANLFTDFKVNGESKKGDNENIVYQCN
jgi:hypothetical protein